MATAPDNTAYSQLTDKQRAFVDALCLEPNISSTKAAEKAGYGKKGAAVEGNRLLKNAKVRQALGERLKDVAPTSEEIALRWDRVSRATLDDFYSLRKVEVENKVPQPLGEAIAAEQAAIAYEREYAPRAAQVLGLGGEDLSEYMAKSEGKVRRMLLRILEWEMQLERNPRATRLVDGPVKHEQQLQLDLVKARKAGVLDLARAIKPTQYGLGVELRDPDAALDKLARMAGAYEKDNEQQAAKITGVGVTIYRAGEKGAANAT